MSRGDSSAVLITGGAGFVGVNLASRLAADGERVIILDNLSRPGVERNVSWLMERYPERVEVKVADVLDERAVFDVVRRASQIYHFAAQVAVTTSIAQPTKDFDINARGTLNVLEAARAQPNPPPLIYTSTNKVYGALPDIELQRQGRRYAPVDPLIEAQGIDETRHLDFHSPYGCSKGAADQYVLDYARCFGMRTVVFRMSCIYGPHQRGNEDQGWVAHFLIRAREGGPLTIYGDGCQVRDLLFVGDLVEAFRLAMADIDRLRGQAFNIGGGPRNAASLLEVLSLLSERLGLDAHTHSGEWRSGDQRYYVSNTSRFMNATGWSPKFSVEQGIDQLNEWVSSVAPRVRDRASRKVVVQ